MLFKGRYAVGTRKSLRELFGDFILHKTYVESYPFEEHTFNSHSVHFETRVILKYLQKFIFKYQIEIDPPEWLTKYLKKIYNCTLHFQKENV